MKFAEHLFVLFLAANSAAICHSSSINLALNRTASQSSVWFQTNAGNCSANRAVDGNNNTIFSGQSCSATNDTPGGPNWWKVDLGQLTRVKMVVLTSRSDCCGSRLDYVIVGITNSTADPVRGSYPLCNQYQSTSQLGQRITLQCNPYADPGQIVIAQQPSSGQGRLTICEFEVYGETVRNTHKWSRNRDRRLITPGSILLIQVSDLHCISECKLTPDCNSVNFRPANNSCELNFSINVFNPGNLTNDDGWSWWREIFVFDP